jgi:hypothetical protein
MTLKEGRRIKTDGKPAVQTKDRMEMLEDWRR